MIEAERRLHHARVQAAARETLADVAGKLRAGLSEADILGLCQASLGARGITRTWYHDALALVLVGERTLWSGSGSVYRPEASAIGRMGDLVTIDLMPCVDGLWGDCARSFVIGGAMEATAHGMDAERRLHALFMETARPEMTLHELHGVMSAEIARLGYRNLDFKGNLGHSIETHRKERRFIEPGCVVRLGEIDLLTFEPHLRRGDEPFAFKHEDVYYLKQGRAFLL